MARTLAVLSDTHGVLPTLEAVLAEPDVIAADLIVVTGDLAAGPQPVPVLERLLTLNDRAVLVRGNADRELVALARGETGTPAAPPIGDWAAAQLPDHLVDLLAALPHPVTISVEGIGDVLCCHGSPRDDDEVVLVDTRLPRWADVLAEVPDSVRVVVGGHTHMPFARLVDRRWVVNPGSTGMPYGSTGVPWALIDRRGIQLRRTEIDPERVAEAVIAGSGYPEVADWVSEYVLHPHSDAEALAAFAPRDGRAPDRDA